MATSSHAKRLPAAAPLLGRGSLRGVGMIEFLLALLLFSVGMVGLLSAQLAGKRAGLEAHQRSMATAMAANMLAHIRANPSRASAYQVSNLGDRMSLRPQPPLDCRVAECTPAQLVLFDLWRWESALLGAAEQEAGLNAGGLVAPRACILQSGAKVSVSLSWRGFSAAREPTESTCGRHVPGLYDTPAGVPGNNLLRRQVVVSAYVGSMP